MQFVRVGKKIGLIASAIVIGCSGALALSTMRAAALDGDGSAESPFLITSCTDFMQISDDLSAHYKLTTSIDCSANGSSITIGNNILAFTGTLDGDNHTMTIAIDDSSFPYDVAGVFNYLGGTVKNITVAGAINTQVITGGLAGYAEYSTIENVHVTASVQGSIAGGIIGEAAGADITKSSSTGTIAGHGNAGGIIGLANGAAITDTTYSGTVAATNESSFAGGIVGDGHNVTLTRTGASGAVNGEGVAGGLVGRASDVSNISLSYSYSSVITTTAEAGGLVGRLGSMTPITDSYTRGTVTSQTAAGGIVGVAESTNIITNVYASGVITAQTRGGIIAGVEDPEELPEIEDSFWDLRDGTNPTTTAGIMAHATSGQSTLKMKNHFSYTRNPARQNAWNFDTIWGINSTDNDGYPFLRWQNWVSNPPRDHDNIPSDIEDAAPNHGDANFDNMPDADEDHVASLLNGRTNKYITLAVDDQCILTSVTPKSESDNEVSDPDFDYPGGLLDFTANCHTPGYTMTVMVYYYDLDTTNLVARKYHPSTHVYSTLDMSSAGINYDDGRPITYMTYSITDGGEHDADGVANGIIVDPAGVATAQTSTPETPGDGDGNEPGDTTGTSGSQLAPTGITLWISGALAIILAVFAILQRRATAKN